MKIKNFIKKKANKTKKFCPFVNSNLDIYLHYNKSFKLPKCIKSKKKCECFPKKKDIVFSYDFPLSFIFMAKKHILKTILEINKHNNMLILLSDCSADLTRKNLFNRLLSEHKNTLKIFKLFITYSKEKIVNRKSRKFKKYLKNQILKCNDFKMHYSFSKTKFITYTCTEILLYSHYHTLKLFECFVNKLQ